MRKVYDLITETIRSFFRNYTLQSDDRLVSVFLYQKSKILRIVYFEIKDCIFSANDRILFVYDRILFDNDRVYSVKIVYFQSRSYTINKDRIFSVKIV